MGSDSYTGVLPRVRAAVRKCVCRQGDNTIGSVCVPHLYMSLRHRECVCVCVCGGRGWGDGGRGSLLTPACDSDRNTCWRPFFPLSLPPSHLIPPSLGAFLSCFGSWNLLTRSLPSFPLTHSPSLAPSTAGLMFLQSLGADEKKGKQRGNVCIFMCGACGSCMPAQKETKRNLCVSYHWGLESRLRCHTSGRQCQNNISFCSTMESLLKSYATFVMWSSSSGNHKDKG